MKKNISIFLSRIERSSDLIERMLAEGAEFCGVFKDHLSRPYTALCTASAYYKIYG